MKIEKVIEELKNLRDGLREWTGLNQRGEEVFDMVIKALEKQIPKKPVKSKKPRYGMGYDYYDWECPTCGSFLAFETDLDRLKKVHHCKCGQAISYVED